MGPDVEGSSNRVCETASVVRGVMMMGIRTIRSGKRRGFFSLELALTLPIFGIVLFALIEFSLLFAARGEIAHACRAGARLAAAPGVTQADVEERVRTVLRPRLGRHAEVWMDPGAATGDVVRVAVIVPMNAVSPDLLWPIGFSLHSRNLVEEARMAKE